MQKVCPTPDSVLSDVIPRLLHSKCKRCASELSLTLGRAEAGYTAGMSEGVEGSDRADWPGWAEVLEGCVDRAGASSRPRGR